MKLPGTIPVRRYLKKYVLYIEQLPEGQPLDLTRRGAIPLFLSSLLVGKLSLDNSRKDKMPLEGYFNDLLDIELDVRKSTRVKIFYGYESIRLLDSFLYDHLHDYLSGLIEIGQWKKTQQSTIIEKFMLDTGIIEDITFDALKKSQSRLRKTRKNQLNYVRKCLSASDDEYLRILRGFPPKPPVP
jgi:hypothetical protein